MNSLKLMSKLCSLIAEYSADDFDRAATTVTANSELGQALASLAKVRRALARPASPPVERPRPATSTETVQPQNDPLARLEEMLLDYSLFGSNRDLVACLQDLELPVEFRYREGRPRIIKKLLRYGGDLPLAQQQSLVENLENQGRLRS
jgi:hypothetical protein